MKKRNWLFLIVGVLVIIAWYILFYKTYSNKAIAKSADIVLTIDVKKNTNTILAYFLTTPGEWNFGSILHFNKDTSFDWKNAIKIPDYIFVFHSKNQPASDYYSIVTIKDEAEFTRGLGAYGFKGINNQSKLSEYYSDKFNVTIIKSNDQLLISNVTAKDSNYIRSVAGEIFTRNQFLEKSTLEKIVKPSNHFTIYFQRSVFLQEDAIVNGNFKKGQLTIDGTIKPASQFLFNEDSFNVSSKSLLSLVFTQPSASVYNSLPSDTKATITTALNFNIDSLLSAKNKNYTLDIESIKSKTDSAVTYTFDDDFNKIEKVVVHQIQEPSFNFIVNGEETNSLLQYFIKNKNIEQNENGNLFTAIPFVKTYASVNENILSLTSYNYIPEKGDEPVKCIASLNINFNKLPTNFGNYLPDYIAKSLKDFESVNFKIKKDDKGVNLLFNIDKNNHSKPFLLF